MFFMYEPCREKTSFLHKRKQRRRADQRLCFGDIDSTIPLLPKYEISSFLQYSVAVQPSLCWTWLEPPKTGFPQRGSYGNHKDAYQTASQSDQCLSYSLYSFNDISWDYLCRSTQQGLNTGPWIPMQTS